MKKYEVCDIRYDTGFRSRIDKDIMPTLVTKDSSSLSGAPKVIEDRKRIRMLTSLEYWRLMGFDDNDHNRAANVVSQNQLFKQAGNSIVVDVLEEIFKQMLEDE